MGNSQSFKPHKAFGWSLERGARVAREEQDEKEKLKEAEEAEVPSDWDAPMP